MIRNPTERAGEQGLRRQNKNQGVRDIGEAALRAVEGEGNERKFTLSFSSEAPYERWFGQEILDHSGSCMDLSRLQSIGCVLFNHDRSQVIAKVDRAWAENGRGMAEITFDEDEASETICQKVRSGTLKGVSVGYRVLAWEDVAANKESSDGRFKGPCSIAKSWMPLEISIVSVPADASVGVGREIDAARHLEIYERQIQVNLNTL